MTSAENILQQAAEDGSFDPTNAEAWPRTLQYILDRLDEIVNDFPKPTFTPPAAPANNLTFRYAPAPSSQDSQIANASQDSHTDKENAPPATPPRPAVPTFEGTPPTSSPQSGSQGFPPETLALYNSIRTALSKNFPKNPPYTIQRLAELILEPKKRYKFLPPYLRALDRVISVSSPSTAFPLPPAVLNPSSGVTLNGTSTTAPTLPLLGSDESLGGALLTPIPWLQNRGSQSELVSESTEIVEGPNGAGRIETVSVMNGQLTSMPPQNQPQIASSHPDGETLPSTGPVTQGEILRQEQEAGVTLSNPHSMQPHRTSMMGAMESGAGGMVMDTVEGGEEEVPHARGPELIGMEDMGPQRNTGGHLDIEGAVGRPCIKSPSKSPGPAGGSPGSATTVSSETVAGEAKDEEMGEGSEKGGQDDKDKKEDEEMTTGA